MYATPIWFDLLRVLEKNIVVRTGAATAYAARNESWKMEQVNYSNNFDIRKN